MSYSIGGQTFLAPVGASDSLQILPNPSVFKVFLTNPVNVNQLSTLQITVFNPNSNPNGNATGLDITDDLPTGLTAVALVSNTCGGTPDLSTNTQIVLTGGSILAEFFLHARCKCNTINTRFFHEYYWCRSGVL